MPLGYEFPPCAKRIHTFLEDGGSGQPRPRCLCGGCVYRVSLARLHQLPTSNKQYWSIVDTRTERELAEAEVKSGNIKTLLGELTPPTDELIAAVDKDLCLDSIEEVTAKLTGYRIRTRPSEEVMQQKRRRKVFVRARAHEVQQRALMMRRLGKSYDEIAKIEGCKALTIQRRVHAALTGIRAPKETVEISRSLELEHVERTMQAMREIVDGEKIVGISRVPTVKERISASGKLLEAIKVHAVLLGTAAAPKAREDRHGNAVPEVHLTSIKILMDMLSPEQLHEFRRQNALAEQRSKLEAIEVTAAKREK